MSDPQQPLRVTLEELADAARSEPGAPLSAAEPPAVASPGAKSYGNINTMPDAPALLHEKGSILLQAWFYLGLAGLLGALAGWGIAEPGFVDGPRNAHGWGNVWMIPLLVTLMCVGFAVAESIVERSTRKALIRADSLCPWAWFWASSSTELQMSSTRSGLASAPRLVFSPFTIPLRGSCADLPGWCWGPRVEWSTASLASR